jgi:hypothetical protein
VNDSKIYAGTVLDLQNLQLLQPTPDQDKTTFVPSLEYTVTMAVLIKLQTEKAGVNSDAAVPSGGEMLKEILCQWSIPYALPTSLNQEPADEPIVIEYSFHGLEDSVEVIPYGNGFVTGLIRAYHQGLHLRLAPEDVWLSILSQLRVCILKFYPLQITQSLPKLSKSGFTKVN